MTATDIDRLHARLVTRAADEGLLDVAYRVLDSPLGALLVAATPEGVVRVGFEVEGHDAVLADLAAHRPHWPLGTLQLEAIRACVGPDADAELARLRVDVAAEREAMVEAVAAARCLASSVR